MHFDSTLLLGNRQGVRDVTSYSRRSRLRTDITWSQHRDKLPGQGEYQGRRPDDRQQKTDTYLVPVAALYELGDRAPPAPLLLTFLSRLDLSGHDSPPCLL